MQENVSESLVAIHLDQDTILTGFCEQDNKAAGCRKRGGNPRV
jgi:hypothetical protein